MALRDLRVSRQEPQPQPAANTPSTSYIDASCELSGNLRFKESLQIDGRIEGSIEGEKNIVIGVQARVRADIKCESVEIFGTVEGDIHARRQITFHKGAKVNGKMRASGIVVEEGSKFNGCIVIGDDDPKDAKAADAHTKPHGVPSIVKPA